MILLLLTWASVAGLVPLWISAPGMAIAIVVDFLRWARMFLVRMVIDLDARNGDGAVIIQRLLPAPNLPETITMSLEDAAEGTPEVNTTGLINTLIVQLKALKWLRAFSVGDLTLRGKGTDFSMTMYSIQDPLGAKAYIQESWKEIAAVKAQQRTEKERQEAIERMTIAVAAGIRQAQTELRGPASAPPAPLPPAPAPSDTPPAPPNGGDDKA